MAQKNNPEHQHFIPRSYLKNFAEHKKDKKYVDALDLATQKKIYTSIKDICVKAGLYTMPNNQASDKYILENYYAKSVDDAYPEVYDLLVNKNITTISKRQKHKIIYTLMSLYFRTPKFLHGMNKMTDSILDSALLMTPQDVSEIKLDWDGNPFVFMRDEIDDIKKQHREKNRQAFLSTHVKQWHDFVKYKSQCGVSVFQIEGEIDLITSDNPVLIHSSSGNRFHLFDPSNVIQVPLDRRHFLYVFPNDEEPGKDKLFRGIRDKWFALTSNIQVQRNAEKWIIGFPGSVEKHLIDQTIYGTVNDENLEAVENIKQKAALMKELVKIAEEHGFFSQPVVDKVVAYKKMKLFEGDYDLEMIVAELLKAKSSKP